MTRAAGFSLQGWPRVRRAALFLACGLSVATVALVARGNDGTLPFCTWLFSLLCGAALAWRSGRRRCLGGREWLLVAGITALAALLRLYRIADIPSGPWVDELATAANAIGLAGGPRFAPFATTPLFADGPTWVRTPNLYLYCCYLVLRASGFGQFGLKLISVLPGIVTPGLVYLLARRFLSRVPAALAAGLLAVSQWHVTASRWGWDEVLVTALVVAMFAKLVDGAKAMGGPACYAAGLIGGLSLYAYAGARVGALAALAFLLLRPSARGRRLVTIGPFLGGIAQASAPLLLYWIAHPATFAVREREISIVPQLMHGNFSPLLANTVSYLLMFWVRGDRNPLQNLPGAPMLDPLVGALFAIGLIAVLLRWRRPESRLAVLWLGVGLLGGLLSLPESAPNSYRVGLVAPACMVLAAIGWRELFARARAARLRSLVRRRALIATVVVLLSGVTTVVAYFETRPADRRCWLAVREGAYCEVIRRVTEHALAHGDTALLDRSLAMITTHLQFDIVMRRARPDARWRWVEVETVRPETLRRAVLLLAPARYWSLQQPLRSLPAKVFRGPFGDEIVVAVSAEASSLPRLSDDEP